MRLNSALLIYVIDAYFCFFSNLSLKDPRNSNSTCRQRERKIFKALILVTIKNRNAKGNNFVLRINESSFAEPR